MCTCSCQRSEWCVSSEKGRNIYTVHTVPALCPLLWCSSIQRLAMTAAPTELLFILAVFLRQLSKAHHMRCPRRPGGLVGTECCRSALYLHHLTNPHLIFATVACEHFLAQLACQSLRGAGWAPCTCIVGGPLPVCPHPGVWLCAYEGYPAVHRGCSRPLSILPGVDNLR